MWPAMGTGFCSSSLRSFDPKEEYCFFDSFVGREHHTIVGNLFNLAVGSHAPCWTGLGLRCC